MKVRRASSLIGLLLIAMAIPPAAGAKPGALTQLPGKAGCVSDRRTSEPEVGRSCALASFGSGQPRGLAISPDGRNAYVASLGAVAAFRIVHGRLRQLRGRAGCFRHDRRFGCTSVPLLVHVQGIALSPDGRTAYVDASSGPRGYILGFSRNRRSGALKRLTGRGGCTGGAGGPCSVARGLSTGAEAVVSPDGRSVYVTSSSGAIVVLGRRPGGRLAQLPGTAGCVNADGREGCATARGVRQGCCALSVSSDGENVYASSTGSAPAPGSSPAQASSLALAAFQRDTPTGALTQLPGDAACVDADGAEGCAVAPFRANSAENVASGIAISPNGRSVYMSHSSIFEGAEGAICGADDDFLALVTRDPATGALGRLVDDRGTCGGDGPVMSPDGRNVYTLAGSFGDLVSVLARDRRTGLLTSAGCVGPFERSCGKTRHMDAPIDMAITPDGHYAYVLADDPGAGGIAVFRRTTR